MRVSCVALALLFCAPAAAQDRVEEARVHFEAGTAAFDRGDYELAVTEFQAAHVITSHPDILFNIYSAAERAGQLDLALASLERYLAEGDVAAERRPVLQARLARLRERAAQAETEPAEVDVQGEAEVEAEVQGSVSVELESRVEPSPEPAPGGVHPAGIGVLIGAGALGASFGVFAALSELEDSRLENECAPTCSDGELGTLTAFNVVADVSWIAASAAAVAGVVLLLALPPDAPSAEVALAPWASPAGGGVVVSARH